MSSPADGRSAATAPAGGTGAAPGPARPEAAAPGPVPPEPGRAGPPGRRTAVAWLAPAAAAAVMAGLGVWGLARGSSMGNDEVATRWAALLPVPRLLRLLGNLDAVHGLYYLLMHGWVALGSSPLVLRIPSVAAAVAAVALTVVIGRRLTGSAWAGLTAGLIMALTPVISYYAQTARSYAMVLACVLAATLVLLRALDAEPGAEPAGEPGAAAGPAARTAARAAQRWWIGYGVLVAVGGYLNEMALLVLAAHAVTVLLARRGAAVRRRWLTAAVASTVAVLPLMLVSAREDRAVGWIPRPGPHDLVVLFHDYFGVDRYAALLVAACAVLAVLPGRGGAGRWWRQGGVSLPSVAAPLLVVPAGLLLAESLVGQPLYVDRYVLYGEAGAALLAGAGAHRAGRWLASRAGWPALAAGPAAAVCLGALLLQLGAQQHERTPQSRMYDFGGPSRYVAARARPGDGILYFGPFFRKAELGYPPDFRKVDDFAVARTPLEAGTFQGTDQPFAAVRPLMLRRARIWVLGRDPSPGLSWKPLREESQLLGRYFTRIARRHFRGITVTLWRRRG